jgi:ATP phosphoribosyltransferase
MKMKFGFPKNKNLKDLVNEMFADAGIVKEDAAARVDYGAIAGDEFEGTACSLKQSTIVEWVAQGRLDGGIVGYDCLCEFNERAQAEGKPFAEPLEFLDIAKCDLVIAAPEKGDIRYLSDLNGKRVATSYPEILKSFAKANDIDLAEIIEMDGSVEMAVPLGMADAVLDITQTGSSLRANNLKQIYNVMSLQAVMIVPQYAVRQEKGLNVYPVMELASQLKRPSIRRKLELKQGGRAAAPRQMVG